MALNIAQMTYGRDAAGRKRLVTDLKADLAAAKKAFADVAEIKSAVAKYWRGPDATKFMEGFETMSQAAGKACTKFGEYVDNALSADAKNFNTMQNTNASQLPKANSKTGYIEEVIEVEPARPINE